jgi:hypothetical protein
VGWFSGIFVLKFANIGDAGALVDVIVDGAVGLAAIE